MWPHLIAIDAPFVGAIWQRAFGKIFKVSIPIGVTLTLAAVIWAVYLSDRWLDAGPGKHHESSDRHRFARKYRNWFGLTSIGMWIIAFVLALTCVPHSYDLPAVITAGLVLIYFAAIHLLSASSVLKLIRKELAVGVLFAAGVALPLFADAAEQSREWLPAVISFASLCWFNCELIHHWEHANTNRYLKPYWFAAAGSLIFAFLCPAALMIMLLISITLLVLLHLFRDRMTGRTLRVLADVALFTPLICIFL